MKKQRFTQCISAVLAVLTLLYSLPLSAFSLFGDSYAQAVPAETDEPIKQTGTAETCILGEITELREANAKHFLMSDGTVVLATYPTAVHYEDGYGRYADIDNTPIAAKSGDRYEIRTGDLTRSAASSSDGELFCIKGKDYSLSFSPVSMEVGTVEVHGPAEAKSEKTVLSDWTDLPAMRSEVRYENVEDGVDLAYVFYGMNTYEYIILKETPEYMTSAFA